MNTTLRICTECRFSISNGEQELERRDYRCGHPEARHLVYGTPLHCSLARSSHGVCGSSGQLFVSKSAANQEPPQANAGLNYA